MQEDRGGSCLKHRSSYCVLRTKSNNLKRSGGWKWSPVGFSFPAFSHLVIQRQVLSFGQKKLQSFLQVVHQSVQHLQQIQPWTRQIQQECVVSLHVYEDLIQRKFNGPEHNNIQPSTHRCGRRFTVVFAGVTSLRRLLTTHQTFCSFIQMDLFGWCENAHQQVYVLMLSFTHIQVENIAIFSHNSDWTH